MAAAALAAALSAPMRAALLAESARQQAARASEPRFRGANAALLAATEREVILAGPAGTGKTWGACEFLDRYARSVPNGHGAIVRKIRADFGTTVRRTWEATIARRGGVEIIGGDHPEAYRYSNGFRVEVLGLDRLSGVLSAEFDAVYGNQAEEFAHEDWANLATRLRGAGSHWRVIFGDANPGPPSHWILSRPGLRLLHSRHEDNPALFTEAGLLTEEGRLYLESLDALPGVLRERLRFGRWVQAEGVVYDEFDRALHVIARAALPKLVRFIASIDFGYRDPFVWQLWGLDAEGRMYLVREIYLSGVIVEDHAERIRELVSADIPEDRSLEATVSDHDREDRETLHRHGVHTLPANKAITAGIQAVQERLRVEHRCGGREDVCADRQRAGAPNRCRPRLFVVEDALDARDEVLAAAHRPVCTAQEFEVYEWKKTANGRPTKEEPLDRDNHGMDAGRYAVAHLDDIGTQVSDTLRARLDARERPRPFTTRRVFRGTGRAA
jgi:phage terminase large subunit